MFARKENKEYRINDEMKSAYLNDGYDIYNEEGKVIEYSPKKTITMNEHLEEVAKLQEELEKANANNSNKELEDKIAELEKALEVANQVPKNAKELKAANEELEKKVAELEAKVQELTPAEGDGNGQIQE